MKAIAFLANPLHAVRSAASRFRGVASLACLLLAGMATAPMAQAQSLPPFGACPIEAYQTIQADDFSTDTYSLYTIDVGVGTLTNIGRDSEMQGNNSGNTNGINAIGFNEADRYIYGWNNSVRQVVRVGADGSAEFIGPTPAGMGSVNAVVGDVFNQKLYLWSSNTLLVVDLATNTLQSTIPTTGVSSLTDWTFNAADGMLYAVRNTDGALLRIDPATGVGTVVPGVSLPAGAAFGAQYFDNQGSLYASRNDGTIFRVRNATGGGTPSVEILTTAAPATNQNDGARCPNAPPPVASIDVAKVLQSESGTIAGQAEPGETLDYRFTLTNSGLASSGATYSFFEVLPAGTTLLSVSGGTIDCPIGSAGARLCTITVSGAIAPGGTATADMQVKVDNPVPTGLTSILNLVLDNATTPPPGCSGSNQACTTPPTCSPTSDPKHCVVTPMSTVDLSMTKAVTPATAKVGDTVTYTLDVGNAGPLAGDGAVVQDPAVTGLDCSAAIVTCSATGGAQCPASPTIAGLQGAGLTIPALPVGDSIHLEFACVVTATP
ncbi:MAG: hypothetical protein QM719_11070 [Thermomonas sp.]